MRARATARLAALLALAPVAAPASAAPEGGAPAAPSAAAPTASAPATTAPAPAPTAPAPAPDVAAARQETFLYLLRTYPERAPEKTLAMAARLVDEGPFAERDRAIYWLGSARLSLGDRRGARAWFARLRREYQGSVWVERSLLGEAEAASQERRYSEALAWYARADGAADPAVRELARLSRMQVLILQARQRLAWAAQAGAALIGALLLASALRRERASAPSWPAAARAVAALPPEAQVVMPVLAVLALIALRQDPGPRGAVLELCGGGALLTWISGARLRALGAGASRAARLGSVALALLAMACVAYVAVWRGDLVGMVLETIRAGPD